MKETPMSFLRPALRPLLALAAAFSLALPASAAMRPGFRPLSGHVPQAAVAQARLLGRVAPGEKVSLALTLPVRNPDGLTEFLRRLYTPGDPMQGRFLTPAEFAALFGPTESDYAAVAAFARQSGLTVTGTHTNRLILDASGPASVVEAALGVRLLRYQARSGRVFRAPSADPSVPAALAGRLAGIVGLDTAAVRRPRLRPALGSAGGSGIGGGYNPTDIRKAYGLTGITQTGAGQAVALFELDGYTPSDIRVYETTNSLPAVPLQNILIDTASGAAGVNADEVTLDIELAQALAPNLSKILVYETLNGTDTNLLDGFSRIASDNLARQVSTSWGAAEGFSSPALLQGENTLFQQMAAQGQSMVSVTGDNGAYDNAGVSTDGLFADPTAAGTLSVDDPGAQPYVTGVGGTTLITDLDGSYSSETVWGNPLETSISPRGSGGGGGFSAVWPVPSYQSGLRNTPPGRSVPDVALNSDPQTGYSIYSGGKWVIFGGTSTAAPLWAGFAALVNEKRAAAGLGAAGFLNPAIYSLGASAAYAANFHDITAGTNLFYPATVGYDNASGWGTPIGSVLLNTLAAALPSASAGTLSGTVTARDTGAALPGAAVTALSASGGVVEAATTAGANGAYTLTLPAGLPLTIQADGYAASGGKYGGAKAAVTLAAGQSTTLSLTLGAAHTFPAGLQMLSVPFVYGSGEDLTALLGLGAPRLALWSPGTSSYVFYPTAPAGTLTAGAGYWARFAAPAYLHYDGASVPVAAAFGIALSAGWNQIGDPFPAPVALSALTVGGVPLASSAAVSPTLFRYDPAAGAYAALAPASDSLQPYAGYWIYARQGVTLSVPPPAGL